HEPIIGQAERGRRKQVITIAIGGEGTWLANQGPDHMVIVNVMLLFAKQARKRKGHRAANIALHGLGTHSHQQRGADQTRRHRVNIGLDLNGTKLTDGHAQFLTRSKHAARKREKRLLFFSKTRASLEITNANEIGEKTLVGFARGKIATGSHPQRLIDRLFELMMRLLNIA